MWCIVNLPNGTQQAVKWDSKAIGQDCLEKVCKALGIICEMEYFGLEHWTPSRKSESRTRQWINLRNRLTFDGCSNSSIQLMLALRVKFWVPVHLILQESVRDIFYTQAKSDLLIHRLRALDWNNAAKLAALLCQADGIHFNELSLRTKFPECKKQFVIQQQQHQKQLNQPLKKQEKKEKDNVLSFKKRRLSKQKSFENITSRHLSVPHNCVSEVPETSQPASPSEPISSISNLFVLNKSFLSATSNNASSASSKNSSISSNYSELEQCISSSPLRIYHDYIVRPTDEIGAQIPEDFFRKIAIEHAKLAQLKMTTQSAKYWLLKEIQELSGYGEEVFYGVTTNENSERCDIAVGVQGITVRTGDEKNVIPFNAIAAAKSFRRSFKLDYVDDHNNRKNFEIKFAKHVLAAGLYRSITERHAFYVCDKVRGIVTNQFTRDLKGTIASMFKEDTELGKRYVFDIQRTCREVYDQARRTLYERGLEIASQVACGANDMNHFAANSTSFMAVSSDISEDDKSVADEISSWNGFNLSSINFLTRKLDFAIREKEEREAFIERCVDTRISEAMTCKICMDRAINTMFNPCCHVMSCTQCAMRCSNCPNCRVKITGAVKIYLPPELRTSQSSITGDIDDIKVDGENQLGQCKTSTDEKAHDTASIATPKLTTV